MRCFKELRPSLYLKYEYYSICEGRNIASCGLYANTKRARDKGEETKLDVKQ